MVDINLDEKNANYSTNTYRIVISNSVYNTNFLKVLYEITYKEDFPVFSSALSFYVYIKEKKGGSTSFTYYPYFVNDTIDNIEVFFSENHPNIPLIVGLKPRGEEIKYYTFRFLRSIEELSKFPENINFQIKNLETQLIIENKIRNKLTFKNNDKSKNYYTKSDSRSFAPFVEFKYSVNRDEFYGPYTLSTDILFDYKEKNDIDNSLLVPVEDKSFDFINVYYSDNNIALLVEFIEYPSGTSPCKSFYFKRLNKNDKKWKLIDNGVELKDVLRQKKVVLEQIFYFINESIKIYINKNIANTGYSAKLIGNSSNINSQNSKEVTLNITIKQDGNLSVGKYTCFYHDLSQIISRDENNMSDVAGLRLYINCDSTKKENNVSNDFEIKLYNDKGTDQKIIYYKPNPDPHGPEDYVYVYFYDSDSVPLLLYQGGNWYKPKSKIEYLDKWIEETGLKDSKPKKLNQFLSDNKILIQLKKINKELNEIVLDYRVNYGLISNEKQMSSGFDTTRIVVIKPEQLKRYRKISHSTKNKGDIGEIKKKDLILEDNEKGKSLSDVISRQMTATFNTLVCYYHTSDLNYELPLLLCIGSSDAENGKSLFYERVNVTENSKWKKIDKIGTFQEEQGLSNKIIDIYYNFSKSVVIEIEKQGIIGYDFKLVDNVGLGSPSSSGINSKIFVFEKHSLLSDSDYTCFEHSIPLMQLSNNHFKIGGLKFYISSTEIFTFLDDNSSSSPIYYEPGKYNVCVYFYHCDTVPLLVVYNNQYYKPKNKNEYFSKWVRVTNIQDLSTQLITQLDSINAELNEVNIMKTSNRNSYGINGHKNGNFSPARINVKTCKNDFFRKVTHTTLNKFGVGKILYNGTQIKSIKKSNFYNEVSVYYLNSDIKYIRPLLISLGSVNSVNFESKWYSITDTEGTLWSNDTNTLNYNTYLKIKKKLIVLHSKYLVPLNVRLENQNHYNNTFTTPDDIHNGVINIDRLRTNNNFSVTNYRCLHHQLYAYYEENEGAIKSKWSLTQSELNFELTLNLFESKLTLIDLQQTLIPLLKYTETDFRDKNNITVYFYEPEIIDSPIVDTVPLMFKFKNRFFVPISKESYFHQWKEVDFQVSDVPIINAIKARLDTINSMLNEIDLSKISNYGIAFCGKYPFFKKGELSTKRIDVSIFSNSKHLIRVHNTSNKFKISKVKPISKCSFDEVSSYLKNKNIVQVAVIYKIGYTTHPELILLNEYSSNYGYLTYLYYYKFEIKPKPFEYRFQNVPNGLSLIDKLTEVEKYQWDTSEHLRPIIRLLREISRKKLVPRIQFPDYDSTDCRKTSHPVLNDDQCEEPFPDESLEKPGQKAKDPDSDHPPGTGSSDPSHDILTLRDVFDYIKKHPEVVYGPGSAVTIAASAYPLYKLILVYKNK